MAKDVRIDTVIFDVGNVLVDFKWREYLESFGFSPKVREAVAAAMFLSPQWDEMDRGLRPDQKYLEAFIQNAPQYEKEIREVYAHCGDCIHTCAYAVSLVQGCREKGCRTYILSNYSRYLFHETEHKMPFREYMDGELFSFQTGQIKPEPEIYRTLLERYDIDPRRALFLDDRKSNLDGASRMDIHALQFFTYERALEDLVDFGIF